MRILALLSLAAVAALAESSGPYLQGDILITHAASHLVPQLPGTGLAPGSLFDVSIEGLYQAGLLNPDDTVTLRFRAPDAGAPADLPVLASQTFAGRTSRLTALVPPATPAGEAEVVVASGAGKTFTARVWIAASNFGLFADAAQVWREGPERARLTSPVLPGDWVTLWGTGLGAAAGAALTVNVAGTSVAPSFAGPAPGQPGLDQINFQFPAGVPDDCYIPVTVAAPGFRTSNVVVLPAASAPGPCRHRLGLSPQDLATLDAGGQIPVSQTWVHSDVIMRPDAASRYSRYDTVSLDVFLRDAAGVQVVTGIREPDAPAAGCTLNAGGGLLGFLEAGRPLDPGRMEVAGPTGQRWPLEGEFSHFQASLSKPDETYDLASVPPSAFTPGEWSLEAPGGADIAAFRVPLRVAPPLRWLNRATLPALGRTDLTLAWDPAGYADGERVRANLSRGMNGISCEAAATAGSITIPASLIAQLPPDTRGSSYATLLLVPWNVTPSLYALPLTSGGALPGLSTFSYLESVTVTWE